jgi:hypothetical protein
MLDHEVLGPPAECRFTVGQGVVEIEEDEAGHIRFWPVAHPTGPTLPSWLSERVVAEERRERRVDVSD